MQLLRLKLSLRAFNPDQPRVPSGHPDGGRWTSGGSGDFGEEPQSLIHRVGNTDDPDPDDSFEGDPPERPASIPEAVLARVLRLVRGLGLAAEVEAEVFRARTSAHVLETQPEEISKTIDVSRSRFGEAARHMDDAIAEGYPDVLTIDRGGADANRSAAKRGLTTVPGFELDEYPLAMFKEGGIGASVRLVDPSSNRALGAYIGRRCFGLPDGAKIKIQMGD